ncbi:succinate dehydrogenase, cytochrome b556 subunit [Salinarimonas sp.]|uniref:succinate dehydrogenase, cytochrome b556 subunit n=1 Tax=Salinarimonas sp. TaxID=2766526 RepID=UPI0032D90715
MAGADTARAESKRPLSPHLQIYRWTWTMAMSIFHRATAIVLYVGTVFLAFWLLALAAGPQAYETAAWFFGSWLGYLILFAYTWALMHHMLGGVRHFVWDFGKGFEPSQRFLLAKLTLVGSVSLTLVIWIVALIAR